MKLLAEWLWPWKGGWALHGEVFAPRCVCRRRSISRRDDDRGVIGRHGKLPRRAWEQLGHGCWDAAGAWHAICGMCPSGCDYSTRLGRRTVVEEGSQTHNANAMSVNGVALICNSSQTLRGETCNPSRPVFTVGPESCCGKVSAFFFRRDPSLSPRPMVCPTRATACSPARHLADVLSVSASGTLGALHQGAVAFQPGDAHIQDGTGG